MFPKTSKSLQHLLLICTVLLAFSGLARAETACGVPGGQGDGWQTAAAADVGLDPQFLCNLAQRFSGDKEANIHAVLVARHGKLVFEQYFNGSDQKWGGPAAQVSFGPAVPHDLRSITKSVVALLLGIGIEKGWVHGVDERVLTLLPDYADLGTPEKDRITLRDLLTMSAGLTWNEDLPYSDPANSESRMDRSPDPCRYVMEQPVAQPAGALWTYSGGSAALIACILHKATGKTIDDLAAENLFKPLGISQVDWARYPSTGEPVAASGLRLLPRDTLKIGQLVLDKGKWHGNQVVPAGWVEDATAPQINGPGSIFYGYQFWLGRSLVNRREIDWAAGVGYGGQRLFIVPALDLVVLVHAGLYDSPKQDWLGNMVLNRFILPASRP